MAEVLGIGDASGLLNPLKLVVERGAVEQVAGVRVFEVDLLHPVVGVFDVTVEQVLAVFVVGFEVGRLDFVADEIGVFRHEIVLDEAEIFLLGLAIELLAADSLFENHQQVHRITGDFFGVVVERFGQNLERKARRDAVHAFVHTRVVSVFLNRLSARVDLLHVLTVIDAHLRPVVGVRMLDQTRQDGETRQHTQGFRSHRRLRQVRRTDHLLVDALFFGRTEAVGNLDHADAVDERFVVLVVLERCPFRFVRVSQHDTVERDGRDGFRADVVAFLGRRQQRVQHLDRRLEHLDELHHPLVAPVQGAREGVGVRIVLAEAFQLANVGLADEAGDVLIVLVARLGLAHRDLFQTRRVDLGHLELRDIAASLLQAFDGPRRRDGLQIALVDAVAFGHHTGVFGGREQTQR